MNDDNLSQRNLSIITSDNPGGPAAHSIPLTFELKPEARSIEFPCFMPAIESRGFVVDEIFINWHNLPKDAYATMYVPNLDITKLIAVASASRSGGANTMSQIDDHTVLFRIGDVSYLPLVWDNENPAPGLLTIQMPPTVRSGQKYRVSVNQISARSRSIIGSFQVSIPVAKAETFVAQAGRELSVLREIGNTIKVGDRWKDVFLKYLAQLEDRYGGLGGQEDGDCHCGHNCKCCRGCGCKGKRRKGEDDVVPAKSLC
jgi:hypothetical protein